MHKASMASWPIGSVFDPSLQSFKLNLKRSGFHITLPVEGYCKTQNLKRSLSTKFSKTRSMLGAGGGGGGGGG